MMAVCTGTVSYLAVNRQANAASAPSSPTNVSLSAGNARITVSWHSPISLGGGSLTNYIIEHRTLGAGSRTTSNAAPTATSHTISGLTTTTSTKYALLLKQPPVQAPTRQSSLLYRMLLQLSLRSTQQQTSRQDKLSPYREAGSCRRGRRLCRWQAMTSPLMLSLQMAQYIVGVLIAMVSLAMVQTPTPTPLSP